MASEEQIRAIISLRTNDVSTDDVAEQLDISRNIVCKTWWDYDSNGKYQEFAPTMPPENILHLENWSGVSEYAQVGEWKDAQDRLNRDKRYQVWEHDNDNHLPYPDENAQAMRSLCRQKLQPDGIAVGSDAFDFPSISRFETDKRVKKFPHLKLARRHWTPHINRLRYDAPDALLKWIDGNHDERAWLMMENDENYDLLFDYHVKTIKANGEVYWTGTGVDALEINVADTLMIVHGWKASTHTAAAMLKEYNYQYSVLAGHSHHPDYYTAGTRYKVSGVIGGCGCQLTPHYDRRKKHNRWQHGYSYAIVDTHTQTAITKHIDFVHTDTHIWCSLDNEVLTVKKQQIGSAAA